MKKIFIILLLSALCFAGTITISNAPQSVTAENNEFSISFNTTCAGTTKNPCNETIDIFYVVSLGVEKKSGWEITYYEPNTKSYGEANCAFSTAKTVCQYVNIPFKVSTASNQKLKIMIYLPDDTYKETGWITISGNEAPPQPQQEIIPEPQVQQPQNNSPPPAAPAPKEKDFFTGVWEWFLSLFGVSP